MKFDFSVAGETLVSREILRIGDHAGDARPAFRAIADDMMSIISQQFESEGSRSGSKWAALQPETVARKARKGFSPKILQASSALKDSLTRRGHGDQRLIITDSWLVFGTEKEYFRYHQLGAPGANVPQRKIITFRELDKKEFTRTLLKYIMTGKT